jgi:transcriptional regulator with XRE-family HTH domain
MDIRTYLTKNGLSRADFARIIGVSEVSVTRYIGGQRMPKPDVMAKIMSVTGGVVTANDFVAEIATEDPSSTLNSAPSRPFRFEESDGEGADETAPLEACSDEQAPVAFGAVTTSEAAE